MSAREYPSQPVVGIGAIVVDDAGRVLLVKRRYEPLAGQWSLPGGALEVGETLEAGVAREILEETGLVVDVGPVVEVDGGKRQWLHDVVRHDHQTRRAAMVADEVTRQQLRDSRQ